MLNNFVNVCMTNDSSRLERPLANQHAITA